jgi:2-polyprenyl-6-methoxyphenol hydroxylase-like FAD-dependent oxidoreductase
MSSRPDRTAIVIGGSIAGLISALLLRRDGWTVDVFERVESELAGRGAGIVTHPDLFAVLRAAGIAIPADIGVAVESRRVFGIDGTCIAERPHPQILTSWDRLYQELRQRIPDARYHKGRNLERVEQDNKKVTAHFADSHTASANLLVGADGLRSAARGQYFPQAQPAYVGYIAWRGLVDEAVIPAGVIDDLFGHFAFALPDGEQMLGYPVAGPDNANRPGERRYNWVWYRPADRHDLADLLRDETGTVHDVSIPPPLIRADVVKAMREAAERVLAPQFATLVRLTTQPFFQPIYDLETPRMAIGRVALIGDAAFVARPHVGAGVTKAGLDASALAAALSHHDGDVEAALRAFERERLHEGNRVIARARHLGAYMQAQVTTAEERANAARFRTPEAVMRDTASLDFLTTPETVSNARPALASLN